MDRKQIEKELARCDREIAEAIADSNRPHTEREHVGILMWECDQRSKRHGLLEELALLLRDEAA